MPQTLTPPERARALLGLVERAQLARRGVVSTRDILDRARPSELAALDVATPQGLARRLAPLAGRCFDARRLTRSQRGGVAAWAVRIAPEAWS